MVPAAGRSTAQTSARKAGAGANVVSTHWPNYGVRKLRKHPCDGPGRCEGRACISHHPDCLFTILGLRGAAGGCGDRQIWLKYFTPDWEPIWSLFLTGTANVHQLPTSSLALCKAFYHQFRWILALNSSMRWAFFPPFYCEKTEAQKGKWQSWEIRALILTLLYQWL